MKIVLTLFLLATSTFALVDENIPTANAVESQKTDLIIKTNNGQTFSINADGKNGQLGTRRNLGDSQRDQRTDEGAMISRGTKNRRQLRKSVGEKKGCRSGKYVINDRRCWRIRRRHHRHLRILNEDTFKGKFNLI